MSHKLLGSISSPFISFSIFSSSSSYQLAYNFIIIQTRTLKKLKKKKEIFLYNFFDMFIFLQSILLYVLCLQTVCDTTLDPSFICIDRPFIFLLRTKYTNWDQALTSILKSLLIMTFLAKLQLGNMLFHIVPLYLRYLVC